MTSLSAPQSLYRRHRPQRFGELVGQDHVTTALRNAVREGRVGHAYLFSGPRGTGKTTTARIVAKALNCLALGDDGEPCGECENCVAVASGTFYDLVELDAASRRGVDAMRDLVSNVSLGVGATARRKVYVIDEVHMLTTEASNTLLKTLEEPPEHVVFVLATTESQKVLPTIRSRTQHFEFTLLSHDELVAHLADVLGREKIEVEPEALDLVARRAAGSARDALSLLDQALALGGGVLDVERVASAFGGTPFEQRCAVLDAIAAEDVAGAFVALHESLTAGSDPRRIAEDLLRTLRDTFVLVNANGRVPYDGPADEAERLTRLAAAMGNPALVRGIETLGQAIVDIRGPATPDPRLVLEVAVARLARRDARTTFEALLERVERLEHQVAGGGPSARAQASTPAVPAPSRNAAAEPAPAPPSGPRPALGAHRAKKQADPAAGSAAAVTEDPPSAPVPPAAAVVAPESGPGFDLDDVVAAWPEALAQLKAPVRALIQEAQPIGVDGATIVFGVPRVRYDATNARFRAEADAIKDALAQHLGQAPRFKLRAHDFDAPGALRPVDADPAPSAPPAEAHDEHEPVDPDELVDAPDAPVSDGMARLVEDFGAQVVEERPRT